MLCVPGIAFAVAAALGQPHGEQRARIAVRRGFIDDAANNFGVTSLRELPDSVDRVAEWVEARRDTGDTSAPEPAVARRWVRFCETETLRSLAAAKALRSGRGKELFTLLNSPVEACGLDIPDALVQLVLERGAAAARPAAAGTSQEVIASDQKRARQTARPIARVLGVPATTDPRLREQGLGAMEGHTADDLEPLPQPTGVHPADVRWAGGESLADVAERCRSLLDDVAARDLPAIVLVTHGDTMRVLLGILDGRSHRDLDWDLPLTNGSVIARDVNLSESHRRLSLS